MVQSCKTNHSSNIGSIPEAAFLHKIYTKVLRVFLLAIHSHLYSFALRFIFLQTHATSYSFYSSVTVHCKGERKNPDRKPNPLPVWFKTSIHKPQVWEIPRLCPETLTNVYVHEFGFCACILSFNNLTHVNLLIWCLINQPSRARICRPFKEPRNRFPAWREGTTTLFVVPARQAT